MLANLRRFTLTFLCGSLTAGVSVLSVNAAEPVIRNLSLRGLQAGTKTTLTVDGVELLPEPKLLLGVPIAEQNVVPGATANRVQFEVTLAEDVTPGVYNLRIAAAGGVSAAELVAVDRLPQLPVAEKIEMLPTTLHGSVTGSTVLKTTFTGQANDELTIEVEAQRLGSKLRPVVHLYDARRVQLAYAWSRRALAGDARLTAKLPADGEYTIEIHDALYAGQGPGHFRLKIGNWDYADLAYPIAVAQGQSAEVELLGGSAGMDAAASLPRVPVTFGDGARWQPAPWAASQNGLGPSGLRPKVLVSQVPEVQEAAQDGDTLQELSLVPVAVSGRLSRAGEEDRYRLSVKPGTKVRLETFAARIGAPVDTEIELCDEQGASLMVNDDGQDTASGDSFLEYTVPAEMSNLIVAVRDIHQRGGATSIYRLEVTPLGEPVPPDFRLKIAQDRCQVVSETQVVIPFIVEREGYEGAIRVVADGLPGGVQVTGDVIPAGASGTLLSVAGGSEKDYALVRWRGTSVDLPQPISRPAEFDTHPLASAQPWLAEEFALAVVPPSADQLAATWAELGENQQQLVLGSKPAYALNFSRSVADGGPVRVTLLTSQVVPRVNGNPDLNKVVRAENQNIEVAVNPQAKQAADALVAAERVVADLQTKQEQATAAATQADTQAAAVVQDAQSKFTAAEKVAVDAAAAQKTAEAAKATADEQVTAAQTAVTNAEGQGDDVKAQAATQLATATTAQAAAVEALNKTTVAAKTAADAQTAAAAVLADAQAKAAATKAAGEQSVAAAKKATDDAIAKRDEAKTAADKAAAEARYDVPVNVIVPATLTESAFEVAFKVEMLSADRQRVLAASYSPVRRLQVLNPILVKPASEEKLARTIDPQAGVTVTVAGSIERLAGMKGDVAVTMEGVPPGVPVPNVNVPADKNEFSLELKFPANFAAGEVTSINLVASGKYEPNLPEVIRSVPVPLAITLAAPAAVTQ